LTGKCIVREKQRPCHVLIPLDEKTMRERKREKERERERERERKREKTGR